LAFEDQTDTTRRTRVLLVRLKQGLRIGYQSEEEKQER